MCTPWHIKLSYEKSAADIHPSHASYMTVQLGGKKIGVRCFSDINVRLWSVWISGPKFDKSWVEVFDLLVFVES